jgi:hypothetical protein
VSSIARRLRRRGKSRGFDLERCVVAGALTREQADDIRLYLARGCSPVAALELASRGWGDEIGDGVAFETAFAELRRGDPGLADRVEALAVHLHPAMP